MFTATDAKRFADARKDTSSLNIHLYNLTIVFLEDIIKDCAKDGLYKTVLQAKDAQWAQLNKEYTIHSIEMTQFGSNLLQTLFDNTEVQRQVISELKKRGFIVESTSKGILISWEKLPSALQK